MGELYNGSTKDFDSFSVGSTPTSPAICFSRFNWLELPTYNRKVAGSSLTWSTNVLTYHKAPNMLPNWLSVYEN